jgi:hypothetical protein
LLAVSNTRATPPLGTLPLIAKRRKALALELADYQREQRRLRRFISGG